MAAATSHAAAWEGWGAEQRCSGIGRCVTAQINLQPGALVLRESPWAAVLRASLRGRRCDYSFAGGSLQRCAESGLWFASRAEQHRAQNEFYDCERRAQEALKKSGKHIGDLPLSLHLVARIVWRSVGKDGGGSSIPWLGMEDHWFEIKDQHAELRRQAEYCAEVVHSGLPAGVIPPDVQSLARLLAVVSVNAMRVVDDDMVDLGLGFYLRGSAFKQSKKPNCTLRFIGTELVISAREHVRKGQGLTIAFTDLPAPGVAQPCSLSEISAGIASAPFDLDTLD